MAEDDPWRLGDEDGATGKTEREATRENVIMIVDVRKPMFEPNKKGEVHIRNALLTIIEMMKDRIVAGDGDTVGVFFLGAKHVPAGGREGLHEYIALDVPNADTIRQLKALVSDDFAKLHEIIGAGEDGKLPIAEAMWACKSAYARAGTKPFDFHRMIVFTYDDNPTRGDAMLADQAIQTARDCAESGQFVVLIRMSRAAGSFDEGVFWRKVIAVDDSEADVRIQHGELDDLQDLIACVRMKSHRKRKYATVPLSFPGGVNIGVGVYHYVMPAKKPTAVKLHSKTNKPVAGQQQRVCNTTGKVLEPHEIKTYQVYGGDKIFVSAADMKAVKDIMPEPAIRILGFKPVTTLGVRHNLRSPYFFQPDEESVEGSTVAFRALITKLVELRRIGIALFTPRAGSIPRIIALLPQTDREDEDGDVVRCAGLWGIPLPYAEDMREVEVEPHEAPTDEQVDAAAEIATRMRFAEDGEFDPSSLKNPVLTKHFAMVEALALGETNTWDPEKDDDAKPDQEGIATLETKYKLFSKFQTATGVTALAAGSRKRAPAGAGAGAGGTAKRSRPAIDPGTIDWKGEAEAGRLSKLTMPILKSYLSQHSLKLSGKKADLVQRVADHAMSH